MIGPDNTPYSYGFYLFNIFIPEEYPFKPPTVKIYTQNENKTRFNPNLYVNGKVCLSILNTWTGLIKDIVLVILQLFYYLFNLWFY